MAQPETGGRALDERGGRGLGLRAVGLASPVIDDMTRPVQGAGAGGSPDAGGLGGAGARPGADDRPQTDVVTGADVRTGADVGPGADERKFARASPDAGRSPGAGGDDRDPDAGRSTADAHANGPARDADPHCRQPPVLPPGQYVPRTLPVLHYGPVPAFRQETWDLKIFGATESGTEVRLCWDDVAAMPVSEVTGDFHCVTKFTVPGLRWAGVLASEVLRRFPPAAAVTHVMIWADFGYSANIRIADFAAESTVLATHRDGGRLTPEHGYPLRLVVPHLYAWKSVKWIRALEYLTRDRRGFWEERGYHNTADPWREQRYSYQEREGEGPAL